MPFAGGTLCAASFEVQMPASRTTKNLDTPLDFMSRLSCESPLQACCYTLRSLWQLPFTSSSHECSCLDLGTSESCLLREADDNRSLYYLRVYHGDGRNRRTRDLKASPRYSV